MTEKSVTPEEYWDIYWNFKHHEYSAKLLRRMKGKRGLRENRLSDTAFDVMNENYHDYLLWNSIYKKYMPDKAGARVLEVGSAPGYHLVRLNRAFGYEPYGVECSQRGVEINRKVFEEFGIDPAKVIHADFFSEEFQGRYKQYFDIIVSRGFIEDFADADAADVIDKHFNLLAEGGYLVVVVPNFSGINYLGLSLFSRELLREVNFNITEKSRFSKLFEGRAMPLYCDYYGTFNCGGRFSPRKDAVMRFVLTFCDTVQRVLNIGFRLALGKKGAESKFFSPYMVFVGVKSGKGLTA